MKAKSGGGSTMSKNVNVPVRTGQPSKGTSPGAADQIGPAVSFKREQVDGGRGYDGAKLGNEVALNVGKGGPGTGRDVHHCGSQGTHGQVNPGETRGEIRGLDTRGKFGGKV